VIVIGKRNIISNCIISTITVKRLMNKGCEAYLAYVLESKKEENQLANLSIVREFPNVFPHELPRVSPEREVEVFIDALLPDTSLIAQSPYRIAPDGLVELKIQLQELLDKGFIRPSNSPYGAAVLF
jgi:hypothetical protein